MQLSILAIMVPRDRLRLVLVLTTRTAHSCSFVFRLKHDVRCTSVTLKVILPSTVSNFQSTHSGVMCTV